MNHNTHFIVRNLNGSTRHTRKGQSWADYYREQSRSKRTMCAVLGCSNQFEVGAHVKITDRRTNNSWYIAPFCKYHNHHSNTDEMLLDKRVVLVSATKKSN